MPTPAHPAGLAHLGLSSKQRGLDGVGMHTWRPAAVVMAHPTCPFDSPEPPLPCLESARQRNQVFSQANPCHLGQALPPTKSLLFPGPQGLCGKDWAEAIWALAAWPGAPCLLLPSSSLLRPSLTPSPQPWPSSTVSRFPRLMADLAE